MARVPANTVTLTLTILQSAADLISARLFLNFDFAISSYPSICSSVRVPAVERKFVLGVSRASDRQTASRQRHCSQASLTPTAVLDSLPPACHAIERHSIAEDYQTLLVTG